MRKFVFATTLFLLICAAAPVVGHEGTHDGLDLTLKAIDVVPTRPQLDSLPGDTQQHLIEAVQDTKRTEWERKRALSLLSFYPDAKTRAFYATTLRTSEVMQLRKMAVYALGRAFGANADGELVATIRLGLSDRDPKVVEFAVRALRYVDHDDARAALREYTSSSNPTLKAVAERALQKNQAPATTKAQ